MSSGNGVQSIGPVGAGIVLINAIAAERAFVCLWGLPLRELNSICAGPNIGVDHIFVSAISLLCTPHAMVPIAKDPTGRQRHPQIKMGQLPMGRYLPIGERHGIPFLPFVLYFVLHIWQQP